MASQLSASAKVTHAYSRQKLQTINERTPILCTDLCSRLEELGVHVDPSKPVSSETTFTQREKSFEGHPKRREDAFQADPRRRTDFLERAFSSKTGDRQTQRPAPWNDLQRQRFNFQPLENQRFNSRPTTRFQWSQNSFTPASLRDVLNLDVFIRLDDPDDVTLRLARLTSKLENLLQSSMTPSQSVKLLKILQVVAKSELHRESGLKILQTVCNSGFLDLQLPALISRLPTRKDCLPLPEFPGHSTTEIVGMIIQLIQQIASRLPSFASKGSLLLTYLEGAQGVMSVVRSARPGLEEDVKQLKQMCEERTAMVQSEGRRRERGRTLNKEDDVPPEDFVTLPIFPARGDMDFSEKPFLRANKKQGAFKDQCHYLDVQFRLLREDYIRPLRVGLHEFRQLRRKGEKPKKCQDVRFYYQVRIASIVCKETLQHQLQFDTTRLKYVKWHTSKRLQFGCLVCLSQDDFETMYFAVVTKREVADLQNGVVQVAFEDGLEEILETSPDDEFTMAETTAFFEASRHVLEGLQEMKQEFPMMRYIVDCHSDVKPPKYLCAAQGSTFMNLSSLLRRDSNFYASEVSVLDPRKWPALEETGFNESQLEAVKTALTKELALIKGPPGTGKTYVGLKIMQVLLDSKDVWNEEDTRRPILVVCYTNHALDQFLEGILEFCPEGIVRVGSRSKNEKLERFNLTNIRREANSLGDACVWARDSSFRELRDLGSAVDERAQDLKTLRKGILRAHCLRKVMLLEQYDSLMGNPSLKKGSILQRTSSFTSNREELFAREERRVMLEWLTLGAAINRECNEESDPYSLLAQEVTSLILNGGDKKELNTVIRSGNVDTVSAARRAQRYRFWLRKMAATQKRKDHKTDSDVGVPSMKASSEILSDADLKPSMAPEELSAIRNLVLKNLEKENSYLIRAWLGVDASSADVTFQFLCGDKDDVCSEDDVTPESVLLLSRNERAKLYRQWLKKAETHYGGKIKKKRRLKKKLLEARKQLKAGMVTDDVLKPVVNSKLFAAIEDHMKKKLEVQKQHCVRAWLGIRDFGRDPLVLEKVYQELLASSQTPSTAVSTPADAAEEGAGKEEEETEVPDQDEQNDERRLEDDEDETVFRREQPINVAELISPFWSETGTNAQTYSDKKVDGDNWSVPASLRKILWEKVQHLLQTTRTITGEEADAVQNLWDSKLTMADRVKLYLHWVRKYRPKLKEKLQEAAAQFVQESKRYQELKLAVDCKLLQRAKVIGMTTTGAARYRKVLSKVGCPIVMIEEAAEVFEAHVVTTLNQSCQHMILIGDHQQLRPSPTVYDLCRNYQLDLSLFERLVNNNLHHSTLAVQHRMRPEVAQYVRHVYPELMDHPTVQNPENRPRMQGMKENVFFFHHEVAETAHDETNSKSNHHEAQLCVGLCQYLLNQGYSPEAITILTAYTGQVLLLKSMMPFKGVRVTSVDNYQGEENDVIILSLVRSNEEGTVGFLGTDNRVCVAISRAKCGFYAFGNFRILAQRSKLWRKIVETAKGNGQMGDKLVLLCVNHPDNQVEITCVDDFKKVPEGGCQLPCETVLDCGHKCQRRCHGYDRDHKTYMCKQKCQRQVCDQNLHPCPNLCWVECGGCRAVVQKIVPSCGHKQKMPCSTDPSTFSCLVRCDKALPCGHPCGGNCGKCGTLKRHTEKCLVEVARTLLCGHVMKMPCHEKEQNVRCKVPCDVTLDCGHRCPGNCCDCLGGRVHVLCKEPCEKLLPGCGHRCPLRCAKACEPCKEMCEMPCTHGMCYHDCKDVCTPCTEPCPWRCGHKPCEGTCDDPCEPCPLKCRRRLRCEHLCVANCGEMCFCFFCEQTWYVPLALDGTILKDARLNVTRFTSLIRLPRCGHIFLTASLDAYIDRKLQLPIGHENLGREDENPFLPRMGLQTFAVANLTCPACPALLLEFDCWRYNRRLHQRYTAQLKAKVKMQELADSREKYRHGHIHNLQSILIRRVARLRDHFGNLLMQIHRGSHLGDTCFAVINQCKLINTAAGVLDLLLTFGLPRDDEVFAALNFAIGDGLTRFIDSVLPSVPWLSEQRCRELTEESRRLAYWAIMICARAQLAGDEKDTQKVDACIQVLRDKAVPQIPTSEMETVLTLCRQRCVVGWDAKIAKSINLKMLDAPYEKDLREFDVPEASKGKAAIESVYENVFSRKPSLQYVLCNKM